jgi:hypothetical protein
VSGTANMSGSSAPMGERDELDTRLRSLMAERLRPVPARPKIPPSALTRYMVLAELTAEIGDEVTVESLYDTLPGEGAA